MPSARCDRQRVLVGPTAASDDERDGAAIPLPVGRRGERDGTGTGGNRRERRRESAGIPEGTATRGNRAPSEGHRRRWIGGPCLQEHPIALDHRAAGRNDLPEDRPALLRLLRAREQHGRIEQGRKAPVAGHREGGRADADPCPIERLDRDGVRTRPDRNRAGELGRREARPQGQGRAAGVCRSSDVAGAGEAWPETDRDRDQAARVLRRRSGPAAEREREHRESDGRSPIHWRMLPRPRGGRTWPRDDAHPIACFHAAAVGFRG